MNFKTTNAQQERTAKIDTKKRHPSKHFYASKLIPPSISIAISFSTSTTDTSSNDAPA
jgi:hypothetical protein